MAECYEVFLALGSFLGFEGLGGLNEFLGFFDGEMEVGMGLRLR